ncbi:MAG: protein translocase subunit SecD [Pseudomonadota bacterium]|uniref:protein translocase subunit SecD n=1 Tax=unclassified Phenylobacterium TaxID=2640670 RepID=UPI0006FBFDD6|nr:MULTISPECIES: protein translocase subunit SecD [unclassified Phenylobacterium]KRB40095.1 preprotein translocase subunit SecD [Phenylobacterium sp. Root700]MBT9469753.1 protein translocase subunit SecD [Phenylobacterium sp.]
MMNLSRWKVAAVVLSVIFGVLFTLPNVLPQSVRDSLPAFLPKQTLNLGLDLQGGSQLLLEVDTDALRAERLTNLVEDVRTQLREANIPFAELRQVNGEVTVLINDPAQVNTAVNKLRTSVGAALAGVPGGRDVAISSTGGGRIRLAFVPEALNAEAAKAVDQSIEIIRRRIDELGTREPTIVRQGVNRILVQAPGESDPERLRAVIGQTAKLTFQMVDDSVTPEEAAAGRIPPGSEALPSADGSVGSYLVKKRALVTGEMLTDAQQAFEPQTGQPVVSFRFNSQGARRFGDATAQNLGKRFAIVLDGKVISAPVIQSAITGGSGQISGSFTPQSANELAILLRAGALPAPLNVEQQSTVGAELGADSIRAGVISLAIGGVAIIVFIVLAYGLFGVFAAIALIVNVLMILGIMSFTQATLTFPGIAGLILTLAVAVDANVLIYERIRDEAHAGRTPMSALEHGYSRALVSILDANITSAISALIMFQFGSGAIRGFAWTLLIGVITSVFTAVIITQVLIGFWFRAKKPKELPIV